jgi:DNA polymerase-3 subunit gamma/tau
MISQRHRPKTLQDVQGNSLPARILKSVSKDPSKSPRNFIFEGPPGVGKTTCARIFPKILNCPSSKSACGKCETCLSIETGGDPRYIEYDVSQVGQVEIMRGLQESLMVSLMEGYRVIVFDEMQMASKEAQTALLKILDDSPKDVFFIFCTTEREKILDTIRSRCVEVNFPPMPREEMSRILRNVAVSEGITIDEEVEERIIIRANGDVRAAYGLLEKVKLLGTTEFKASVRLLDPLFSEYFKALSNNECNVDQVRGIVSSIIEEPVEYIREDFSRFMRKIAEHLFKSANTRPSYSTQLENTVLFWLENQQYLEKTNDWYIFLLGIRRFFPRKAD